MTILLVLSEVPDLAMETDVPNLRPAESLSSLLLAGFRPDPASPVVRVGQDVTRRMIGCATRDAPGIGVLAEESQMPRGIFARRELVGCSPFFATSN